MFEIVDFIYNNVERKVLIDKTDSNGDIFGFDLNLLPEDVKEKLNASYRRFKKNKIKTNNNVEKIEEKPKKFEI